MTRVAVFDTAFHATLPDFRTPIALARHAAQERTANPWIHHRSCDRVARHMAFAAQEMRRVITLHLSGRSNACAILYGQAST